MIRIQFVKEAVEAGFTQKQAEFMGASLSMYPHVHIVEEIEGLDDAIAEAVCEETEEDEDESEEE